MKNNLCRQKTGVADSFRYFCRIYGKKMKIYSHTEPFEFCLLYTSDAADEQ